MTALDRYAQSQKVAEALTAAYQADPRAIRALIINRVPCGQGLIDDPCVTVDGMYCDPPDCAWVGALGLVNGTLNALGLPIVCVRFSEVTDVEGRREVVGFSVYREPAKEDDGKAS